MTGRDPELALLACILLEPAVLDEVGDVVSPAEFAVPLHAAAFEAMRALRDRGDHVDIVSLRAHLLASGAADGNALDRFVLVMSDHIPDTTAAETYARLVSGASAVRAVTREASAIVARSRAPLADGGDVDAFLDAAEAGILTATGGRRSDVRTVGMSEALHEASRALVARAESKAELDGLSTGMANLDRTLAGLRAGELVVLAGRPGMGKSAFAGHIVRTAAGDGHTCAVYSLEMEHRSWAERWACAEGGVDAGAVRRGKLSRDQWDRWWAASERLASLPIVVDDTPSLSLPALRSKARRVRARHGLGLIVVDYLQLMTSGEGHRERNDEVGAVSRGLKALAKELSVPVLALAQLNRGLESRKDKRPSLSDLRESGQIEQDADVVMFLYRPGIYAPELASPSALEVIIAKQRAGRTGTVKGTFHGATYRFDGAPDNENGRYDDA